jgi:hypothetical protein
MKRVPIGPYAHICNEPIVTAEKQRFADITLKVAEKFTKLPSADHLCAPEFATTENEAEFEIALIEYVTRCNRVAGYDGCVNITHFFEEYFTLPRPILVLSFLGDAIILYRRLKWVGMTELASCMLECIIRVYTHSLNTHHLT